MKKELAFYGIDPDRLPSHVAILVKAEDFMLSLENAALSSALDGEVPLFFRLMKSAFDLESLRFISICLFSENLPSSSFDEGRLLNDFDRSKGSILWVKLIEVLLKRVDLLKKYGVRCQYMGEVENFSDDFKKQITSLVESTADNMSTCLNIVLDYDGREEVVNALNHFLEKRSEVLSDLTIETFSSYFLSKVPDIDLFIQMSGVRSLTKFMLWHIPYAELLFLEKSWLEFKYEDFFHAIYNYQQRSRRFGSL
ncbi:hypothetical protein AB834_03455 [PVC group bacterium (ex Bugula neritina AB1)]|nr:hypothetical protein AB834_03455 [PVC group bacterium (ex Bugula neritina AB1)]